MVIKKVININDNSLLNGLSPVLEIINLIENSNDDNVEIDFTDTNFVSPLFLLPLMVFVIGHKKNISYSNISQYMNIVKFGEGVKPDEIVDGNFSDYMQRYNNKTYIPIVNFVATIDKHQDRDSIITSIEAILEKQLSLERNIISGLKYLIGELVDNISEHAKSDRAYIFTQAYPYKKYLDLCIADTGVTLLGSYRTLPNNEIGSNIEAMQAANRGISTKNLPEAENRGYGIRTSKNMLINGLGGSFVMISGNAIHARNRIVDKFLELPQTIEWKGTIIALRIPYQNKGFQYIDYVE